MAINLGGINKKYLIIGGAVLLLFIAGILLLATASKKGGNGTGTPCTGPNCPGTGSTPKTDEGEITMWDLFDDSSVWEPIIAEFNKAYPNIKVHYTKKQFDGYEANLVDALASGSGPDMFVMQNHWLPKHLAKLVPADPTILSIDEFSNSFVPSAIKDFTANNKVYGVPLYTDNMVLFYNKKMFQKAQIYEAPRYWSDVVADVALLTQKANGDPTQIEQSGIAMGTAGNISKANDILLLLMMQNGTPIISKDNRTFNFNQFVKDYQNQPVYPGTKALDFFTAFSNNTKSAYCWNDTIENSNAAFAHEKVAMVLGYSYFIPIIERANPNLSYAIVPVPQLAVGADNITLANYWGWGVSKTSKSSGAAWTFLRYLLTKDVLQKYLQSTQKASPLKNIKGGGNIAFENQKLYAQTIYKGSGEAFDQIILDMINDVAKFNQSSQSAIDTAARKANEMLQQYY